jgi:hypothetical protein
MSEKTAYDWLRTKVFLSVDRVDRLENLVVVGMPDVNVCVCGTELWIEIKAPKEPARAKTALFASNHKLSQDQINWMLRQRKANGNAYIFINTDKRRLLLQAKHAESINNMTLAEIKDAAIWKSTTLRSTEEERINLRNALMAGF